MKKPVYFLSLLFLLISCKDNNDPEPVPEADTTPPGTVTNVTSRPGYGEVTLKWKRPADEDYGYTVVAYARNSEPQTVQAKDSITIEGFEDTQSYEFSLSSVDKNQNKAEPVKIAVAPKSPPCVIVDQTIDAIAIAGGVKVAWRNITNKVVTISVSYTDKAGEAQVAKKISTKAEDFIDLKLKANEEQEINVTVSSGKLQQPAKQFVVTPFNDPVDKSQWAIASFSSEEATGEGQNNGRAIHSIDGNASTFWHTKWSDSYVPILPNYIVYDIQKTSSLTWVKVSQREGAKSLQTVQIMISPDNQDFIQVGELTFPDAAGGSQEITFSEPVQGRYLKLNIPDSRSSGKHSMIAEIFVTGEIIEE